MVNKEFAFFQSQFEYLLYLGQLKNNAFFEMDHYGNYICFSTIFIHL